MHRLLHVLTLPCIAEQFNKGALSCGYSHASRHGRRRKDPKIVNVVGEERSRAIPARERVREPLWEGARLGSPEGQTFSELDVVSDSLPSQGGSTSDVKPWHSPLQHHQTLVAVERRRRQAIQAWTETHQPTGARILGCQVRGDAEGFKVVQAQWAPRNCPRHEIPD
jgi:hypothetical protein